MPDRPDPASVERGGLYTVTADALGREGDAIARLRPGDQYVVLVPGLLPGEQGLVKITSAARKFGRGELVQVTRPSADRSEPRCRHFGRCGGCDLQHLLYARQLERKAERLRAVLRHALGDAAPPLQPFRAPDPPFGQRHKVALHLSGRGHTLQGGLRMARSPELVPIEECPVSDPEALGLALDAVYALQELDLPATDRPGGILRSLVVRRAAGTGEAALLVVATRRIVPGLQRLCAELQRLGATVVAANWNEGDTGRLLGPHTAVLAGPERIRERILGTTYSLSPDAFFQTSPWGAAQLVELVTAALRPGPGDRVLDLYCGVGLFALHLAPQVAAVHGIEESPAAVADAEATAALLSAGRATFARGAVERQLQALRRGPRPTLVVLDPPRQGCGPAVAAAVGALGPARIAYVSCDPDALGRDLAAFAAARYRCTAVTPVDMFPHTHHLEAVAVLERA